jgi:hypothetical protein
VCNKMFDGRAVNNGDARFRALERKGSQACSLPTAHDTHLHTEVFVFYRFNYTDNYVPGGEQRWVTTSTG